MNLTSLVVVLLGGPGAGKGTQAERLSAALGVPHVSTGDLFREHLRAGTALGLAAQGFMERGELVPDEVTAGMARERLARPDCAGGAILDGFPRTVAQALALEGMLAELGTKVSVVPFIVVPDEVLLARLAGRWTCRGCGALYHQLFGPPKVTGVCDRCGGALYQRADDTPETQRRRIEVYLAQTAPLVEFYRAKGLLVEVDGLAGIEGVQAALLGVIGALGPAKGRERRERGMISLKSEQELALMRQAGRIVAEVLARIEAELVPGMTTAALEAIAGQVIVDKHGAIPSFKGYRGYPGLMCASVNEEIVHGIPGPRRLVEGDIVGVDVGAIYRGYHGDAAITLAVGEVDEESRRLMDVTAEALRRGIEAAQAGQLDGGHLAGGAGVRGGAGLCGGAGVHGARDRPEDARGPAGAELLRAEDGQRATAAGDDGRAGADGERR